MTTRYHISKKTKKPAVCVAKTADSCRAEPAFGEKNMPHFVSETEAKKYVEDINSLMYSTFPSQRSSKPAETSTENVSNENMSTVADNVNSHFDTYGKGKEKQVSDRTGKRWDPVLSVTSRSADVPEKHNIDDRQSVDNSVEILVDGNVAGYVSQNENSVLPFAFQTVEQANNDTVQHRFRYDKKIDAIGELVSQHQDHYGKETELHEEDDLYGIYRNEPKIIDVDEDTQLYTETRKPMFKGQPTYQHIFLVDKGTPVSFLKVSIKEEDDGDTVYTRCDAETRAPYQRQGYATKMTRLMEEQYGKPLETSGTYTELGFAAFGGKSDNGDSKPSVDRMSFVYDWDRLYPEFSL